MKSEQYYEDLDDELVDILQKHLGPKWSVWRTGTTDPRWYKEHEKLGKGTIPGITLMINNKKP